MKTLSIIVPCYNEEQALKLYFSEVDKIIKDIKDYQIDFILVNDGSKDKTLEIMEELYQTRNDINYINLARNSGQNAALSAGLYASKADYIIMMDADLQDPVYLIKDICEKFTLGYEVVSPHRSSRKTDSKFKRDSASFFYKFVNKLEGKKIIPENVNCFRGLSKRAVETIKSLPEKDRLLVSEIPLIGYKSCYIDFQREKRVAGKSKYNINKMVNYAFDIISSSTSKPLYLPIKIGSILFGIFSLTSLTLLILYILSSLRIFDYYHTNLYLGFMIVSFILLAMSLIIFVLGIICIYLHNILINTRNRPTFIYDYIKWAKDKKEDITKK